MAGQFMICGALILEPMWFSSSSIPLPKLNEQPSQTQTYYSLASELSMLGLVCTLSGAFPQVMLCCPWPEDCIFYNRGGGTQALGVLLPCKDSELTLCCSIRMAYLSFLPLFSLHCFSLSHDCKY